MSFCQFQFRSPAYLSTVFFIPYSNLLPVTPSSIFYSSKKPIKINYDKVFLTNKITSTIDLPWKPNWMFERPSTPFVCLYSRSRMINSSTFLPCRASILVYMPTNVFSPLTVVPVSKLVAVVPDCSFQTSGKTLIANPSLSAL